METTETNSNNVEQNYPKLTCYQAVALAGLITLTNRSDYELVRDWLCTKEELSYWNKDRPIYTPLIIEITSCLPQLIQDSISFFLIRNFLELMAKDFSLKEQKNLHEHLIKSPVTKAALITGFANYHTQVSLRSIRAQENSNFINYEAPDVPKKTSLAQLRSRLGI